MKGNDLLNKMELVDPAFIEQADKEPCRKKNRLLRYGAMAACLAVLTLAIGLPMIFRRNTDATIDGYPVKHFAKENTYDEGAIPVPHWEEMVNAQRYSTLTYGQLEYGTRLIAVHRENVAEKLGEATVTGQDYYTGELHTMTGELFAVKGIDTEAAVCFRFDPDDEYAYAYANTHFTPDTLGAFITALDLQNRMTTGLVYDERNLENSIVYEDISTATVWELLLADRSLRNQPDAKVGTTVMSISTAVDVLGYHNVTISLTEDGYLWTNILDTGKYFYIGQDAVNGFIREVTEHHQGYIYIYDLYGLTEALDE